MNDQLPSYKDPLLVSARELARQIGVSLRHIWRLNSMGKLPKPLKIGHSVRWISSEIEAWLEAGAPDRKKWEAMKKQKRTSRIIE